MRALPAAALVDLRRRYRFLERTFEVPMVDVAMDAIGGLEEGRAAPIGELPPDHPAMGPASPGLEDPQAAPFPPPPAEDEDAVVPLLPALLWAGRSALSAMLMGWWATWRRRRGGTSAGQALQDIISTGATRRPRGALATWLTALGWDGEDIGPLQTAAWLRAWQNEQSQARAASLRPWERGPGAGRPAVADQYRISRQLFQRRRSVRGVRDGDGVWHDDADGMERALWASRREVWGSAPSLPACGEALLAAYFRERRAECSAAPRPRWRRLLRVVLGPHGNAPGVDGEPYEAYHPGARFVACLLAQAMYAADLGDQELEAALGASVDLLVLILKYAGAEDPTGMRPLQLPPCFRRLYGAAITAEIRPQVEPQLSRHQAATAGGHCGPNIRAAFAHLASCPGLPRSAGSAMAGRPWPGGARRRRCSPGCGPPGHCVLPCRPIRRSVMGF